MRSILEALRQKRLFWLVLLLLFLGSRYAVFHSDFDGNDGNGHYSYVFLKHTRGPAYHLIYRIGENQAFIPPSHPAPMYEFSRIYGLAAAHFLDFNKLSADRLIPALKLLFSVPQLLILGLALCFLPKRLKGYQLLILLGLALGPIAINGSNETQPDSSYGLLAAGLLGLSSLVDSRGSHRLLASMCFFLGIFLLSAGKTEWAVAVLGGLAGGFLALGATSGRWEWKTALVGLSALLSGSAASYWIDPYNYQAGSRLLREMILHHSAISMADGAVNRDIQFHERLPFIFPILVSFLLIASFTWKTRQLKSLQAAALGIGTCLFTGYLVNSWSSFPRYFAPSWILLGLLALSLPLENLPTRSKGFAHGILALSLFFCLRTDWRHYRRITPFQPILRPRTDCVYIVDVFHAIAQPELAFIHPQIGGDDIHSILARLNKTACP